MFSRDPTGSALTAESLNPPETLAPSAPAAIPSFLEVLLAPVHGIFDPMAAARTLTSAPPRAYWTTFIFLCAVYALAIALIPIIEVMLETDSSVPDVISAWRTVNHNTQFSTVEFSFAAGLFVLPILVAMSTWFMLTRTLRNEPVLAAAGRMLRAQTSNALLCLIIGGLYFALAVFITGRHNHWLTLFISIYVPSEPFTAVIGLYLGVWLARRVEIAATVVENDGVRAALAPRCEGCGYDLSHSPADGICTECGQEVDRSLTPGIRRSGCDWENDPQRTAAAWCRTSWTIFTSPRRFYESLAADTELSAARRFAALHLRYIGLIAACWIVITIVAERWWNQRLWSGTLSQYAVSALIAIAFVVALAQGTSFARFAPWRWRSLAWFLLPLLLVTLNFSTEGIAFVRPEVPWVAVMLFAAARLVCWFGQRLGGAIVSSIAIYFGVLPDYRRAEKVILYESVVLWVYCVGWAALFTSFMFFGNWMSNSPLLSWLSRVFRLPPEPVIIFGSTIALSIFWARRYWIAFRAIRWANF